MEPFKGRLTYDDLPEIYKKLQEDLPAEAIQHVSKDDSRKSYDMTGYAYQYCVNRLNEVIFGHWRPVHKILHEEKGQTAKGKTMYSVLMHMTIQIGNYHFNPETGENHFEVLASVDNYGGHESLSLVDARKGAYSNAFKKAVAMLGVGRKAFEGQLDDDYKFYQIQKEVEELIESLVKSKEEKEKLHQALKERVGEYEEVSKMTSKQAERAIQFLTQWRKNMQNKSKAPQKKAQ